MYKRLTENFEKTFEFETTGKFDFPIIYKACIQLDPNTKSFNNRNSNCVALHFFIDDYQFDRLWRNPAAYIDMFKSYRYICSPDYSLFLDHPLAVQIWNTYKKQALGAFYQHHGIDVIPTVSWSDERSYDWCFDGIEVGSIVACSSVGCLKNKEAKELFIKGFEEMINRLKPKQILMNGKLPIELNKYNSLCVFIMTNQEMIRERVSND